MEAVSPHVSSSPPPLSPLLPCFLPLARDELVTRGGDGSNHRLNSKSEPLFLTIDELQQTGSTRSGSAAGEKALVPTLYTLHIAPQILRPVFVYSGVSKPICRGADLFTPGVVKPEEIRGDGAGSGGGAAMLKGVTWPELVFGGPFAAGEVSVARAILRPFSKACGRAALPRRRTCQCIRNRSPTTAMNT